jgi:hypothetical protein
LGGAGSSPVPGTKNDKIIQYSKFILLLMD